MPSKKLTVEKVKEDLLKKAETKKYFWLWAAKRANKDNIIVVARIDAPPFPFINGPFPIFCLQGEKNSILSYFNTIGYHILCNYSVKEDYNNYEPPTNNLTQMKEYFDNIHELIKDLTDGSEIIPDVVNKKEIFEKAKKEYENAMSNYIKQFKCYELLQLAHLKEVEIKMKINESKTKMILKDSIEKWFVEAKRGKEGSYKWKIVWQSENGKYGIMYVPGETSWSGRGQKSYYPSQCHLFSVDNKDRCTWADGIIHEFEEGKRFSKKMIEEAVGIIKKYEKR